MEAEILLMLRYSIYIIIENCIKNLKAIYLWNYSEPYNNDYRVFLTCLPGKPDAYKPTFSYTRRQNKSLTDLYLYQDIIFDVRIEILALTNIHWDIHNGILECDLHICTWQASRMSLQEPPGGQILFLIWELKSWPLQTYL